MIFSPKRTLILLLLCAIALVSFRQNITSAFYGFFIKKHLQKSYGIELSYDAIAWQENKWIITNPTFLGRVEAQAKMMFFEGDTDAGSINIENANFFDSSHKFHINAGWSDHDNISLELKGMGENQPTINLKGVQNHITVHGNQIPSWMAQVFLSKILKSNIALLDGSFDGIFDVSYDETKRLQAHGSLSGQRLLVQKDALTFELPEVSYTVKTENNEIISNIEFLKSATLTLQGAVEPSLVINDIAGNIEHHQSGNLQVSAKATCCRKEKAHEIALQGNADLHTGKMHCDLCVKENDIIFSKATLQVLPDAEKCRLQLTLDPSPFVPFLGNVISINALFHDGVLPRIEGTLCEFYPNDESVEMTFGVDFEAYKEQNPSDHWMKQFLTLSGLTVKKGCFQARNLLLQNYLSNWLGDNLQVEGLGSLSAVFDSRACILQYNLEKYLIKHSDWELTENLSDKSDEFPFVHYLNWETGEHGGFIALNDARLADTAKQFDFTNISGLVFLSKNSLSIKELETFCKGIFFAGELSASIADEEKTHVHINVERVNGSLSQLKECLSSAHSLLDIPLEANLNIHESNSSIALTLTPEGISVDDVQMQGILTDGVIASEKISLQDVSSNFSYSSKNKAISLTDLQGVLLLGSPSRAEEYLFAGDYILFDLPSKIFKFDVWIGDRNHDLFRLAGQGENSKNNKMEFVLNHQLTHFGDIHPDLFKLVVKDGTTIDQLALKFDFSVGSLCNDLKRFSRTGFLMLSRHLLQELNQIHNPRGQCSLILDYNDALNLLTFDIKASDLNFNSQTISSGHLKGRRKGQIWTIDQLKLDRLSLGAEFFQIDDKWKISFLGAQVDNDFIFGIEGDYLPLQKKFVGKINLVEIFNNSLREWPAFKTFMEQWKPAKNGRSLRIDWLSPVDIQATVDCCIQNEMFDVSITTKLPNFLSGVATFKQRSHPQALLINWSRDIGRGISVESIQGECLGINASLKRGSEDNHYEGTLALRSTKAVPFLPPEIKEAIQYWKIDGNYKFSGNWKFDRPDKLAFKGTCEGRNLHINGMLIDQFTADIEYKPYEIDFRNIALKDLAGNAEIPVAKVQVYSPSLWHVGIPTTSLKNFHLSKLRNSSLQPICDHSLVIEKLTVKDLKGNVKDFTTLQGTGELKFLNQADPEKKHTIWNIPNEILGKLGLDLTALTPMSGIVHYELESGKIYLKRLKDVFSDGHLSKFYLSKKGTKPSYIDLEGNLFIQLRMKQYNLLLKLAELFTLTISGTLAKPTYSLFKL